MYPFKKIFFILLTFNFFQTSMAASQRTKRVEEAPAPVVEYHTLGWTYFSWAEKMTVDKAGSLKSGWANFNGMNIQYESEEYSKRLGYRLVGQLFLGQASAGNTSLGYTATYQSFYGLGLQGHFVYRKTATVLFSAGPLLVYRNITWPTPTGISSAVSGQDTNVGLTVDIKMRISPHIDVIQSLGFLYFNSSTYWNVGLGYKL